MVNKNKRRKRNNDMKITIDDLFELVKLDSYNSNKDYTGSVKIDADDVNNGDIFIAVNSKKYDLTDGAMGFTNNEDSVSGLGGTIDLRKVVNTALHNGATYIFIDSKELFNEINNKKCFLIDDCLTLIIDIAKYIVNKSHVKTIAVTGSMGKTSTVFAIYNLLSVKYSVIRIHRIRNSVLGMALEIIDQLNANTDFLIVEMQLDGKNQIDSFCKIAKPDYSIITSINFSHYSRFQNIERVLYEKTAVYRNLKGNGKCLINGDDLLLSKWAKEQMDNRILRIGFSEDNDLFFSEVKKYGTLNYFTVSLSGLVKIENLKTNINNRGMLQASLYSIYFAKNFNLELKQIQHVIDKMNSPVGRFNGFNGVNDALIIIDSYNANSNSMINGLEYVNGLKDYEIKIIILGSLLELGDKTESEHVKVGEYINQYCHFNYVITLGEGASYIAKQINNKSVTVKSFFDYEDIIEYIKNNVFIDSSTAVYLKGSGGMRMELLAPYLLNKKLF